MTTLTIYGIQTHYDPKSKRTDSELTKFDIDLMDAETWKAPLGFNVTTIKVNA